MKIYKVQLPIGGAADYALIYDEKGEEDLYMPADDEALQDFMKGRPKAYVYGKIVIHAGVERFGFAGEAPWQDW